MYAVISPLDPVHDARVRAIWQDLETRCGLTAIQQTPIPHFSWYGAQAFDKPRLMPLLEEIAGQTTPFTVRTAGLGIFSGPRPILVLALVKDARLLQLHQSIWERTSPTATELSSHYTPASWMPHITLAYGDLTPTNITCVMERLVFEPFHWGIPVTALGLIGQSDRQIYEDCCCFPFRKEIT